MNYADFFTQPNGFPLESDATLGFMQTDYQSAIIALAKMSGSDLIIVTGLVESGSSVSDGWILYDGDLVYFEAGTKSSTFIIQETVTQKANQNGTLVDRYTVKKAMFGSGSGSIAYNTLKRIQSLDQLVTRVKNMIAFESAVVLSGMAVSSVNTGASTLVIAAGAALIDNVFVDTQAYSGQYPVYLKPDGEFTLAVPGSGSYITFNPYTSQRYADVLRRATTPAGQVIMTTVLNDRFDGTGLGRWEMQGFAVMNGSNGTFDMRGRFPVAYDNRAVDPGNGIWGAEYFVMNSTGGEKDHALTIAEMPAHNHTENTVSGGSVDQGEYGLIPRSTSGQNVTVTGVDSTNAGTEPNVKDIPQDIPFQGGGDAHENRPPFRVFLFVQRI